MQKIVPNLWFNNEAKSASEFYVSVFPTLNGQLESKVTSSKVLHNTPSGDTEIMEFKIWGYSFAAISAGPYFKLNPSISFMVNFDPSQDAQAQTRIDEVWSKLSNGGKVLMPIDKYPFSERYGWVEDKYGVSWQLILTKPEGEDRPLVIPALLFAGAVAGKTEEATEFYLSVFKNSKRGSIVRYPAGMEPEKEGTIMFTDFLLEGQWFAAMDSAQNHEFKFNEAASLIVYCNNQEEIDYYWSKLSAVPESEQCGWLKDKYGVSWQITPTLLGSMLSKGSPKQVNRVTECFLKMKKFDIAELQKAYDN